MRHVGFIGLGARGMGLLQDIVLHIRDIAECDRHRIADVVADSECGLKTLQTPTDWS